MLLSAQMSTDFIAVKQAAKRFAKAEKTIYRFIEPIIVAEPTHPDRYAIRPTPEEILALKRQRKKIKYTIRLDLLNRRFTQPTDDQDTRQPTRQGTDRTPHFTATEELYDQRIADLKEQLKQAGQREKDLKAEAKARENKLLDYAQADKQLFARAAESLTQVLALPGITEATNAQKSSTIIDTTPKSDPVKQKPRTTTKPTPKPTTTKKKTPAKQPAINKRSALSRFWFGNKKYT